MALIIAPKTEAVASAVEFTVAEDKGTLRMTADPGSGAFTIKVLGFPDDVLLTLDTDTTTATELTLNPGSFTVTKEETGNACGLYCDGRHVDCEAPG